MENLDEFRALHEFADRLITDASKDGAAELTGQIEQVSQLPRAKQKFVVEMLDTVIQQQTGS